MRYQSKKEKAPYGTSIMVMLNNFNRRGGITDGFNEVKIYLLNSL